jgi:phosphatidylglycerophosphate synthase
MTPYRRDILLLPNLVSLARIVLILVAAAMFVAGWPLAALLVGVPAGLSDYLDGYLARKRGETTELGALLDSLADILFILTCLVIAVHAGVWPAYLIVAWGFRDMSVMTLRGSAGLQGFMIRSSFLAKLGFNFNCYSCVLMAVDVARPFAAPLAGDIVHWVALGGIHAGIAMQWISGWIYAAEYARKYRGRTP